MDAATERLVEKVGLRFEADGLSRTAGRILGYLLLSPEARSLDELAGALRVSKAGVSSNARLLETAGAIERATHPGDRRDYYRVAEDLHERMLEHWLQGVRDVHGLLSGALAEGGVSRDPVVRGRLETFAAFFAYVLEAIEGLGGRLAERQAGAGAGAEQNGTGRTSGSVVRAAARRS